MISQHIISSSEALEDINVTAMAPLPAPAELHTHLILRGGTQPNYGAEVVASSRACLAAQALPLAVMIDCSHGNCANDPARQTVVAREVVARRAAGEAGIMGLMIESHIAWGNQSFKPGAGQLQYGVSITDACIDWATTAALLRELDAML